MKNFKKMISLALSAVMLAAVIPTSALAAAATKAVKENIDWENWILSDEKSETLLDGEPIYVLKSDGSNTALNSTAYPDKKMRIYIDDAGSTTNQSYVIASQSGYPSDGTNWGFMGTKYYTGLLGAEASRVFEFPTDRWLGVKDISAYKDTGYAVFTIESVSGDADNAYLSIKTVPQDEDVKEVACRMRGDALVNPEDTNAFPITPERYPVRDADQPFEEFYSTKVVGVKLTDYYDVSKGGMQTVVVPLSKFVDSPDFKEVYIPLPSPADEEAVKKYIPETFETKRNLALDLRLFGGMGIARKDSGKKQSFSAVITDLAIVAPQVPEAPYCETDEGFFWAEAGFTTDEDVTFKLKRTCAGKSEYIDFDEGFYEEYDFDNSKTYTVQVVAIDNTYGVEVASEPVYVGAAGVEIEKAAMNWKDWVGDADGHNYLEGEKYFKGNVTAYNNYEDKMYCGGGNFVVNIDDHNVGSDNSIAQKIYESIDDITIKTVDGKEVHENNSDLVDIPNAGGFWGYQGMSYGNLMKYPDKTKIPADVWFGIKTIKDWESSGYAVFTVNSVSGDAKNAYLAITTLTDQFQLGEWAHDTNLELPIVKQENETRSWDEHGFSIVAGVNLTDYYDVKKGGVQTVAVPLDKLVNNPDFQEINGKVYGIATEDEKTGLLGFYAGDEFEFPKPNLHLFTGMGIARRDAGSTNTFATTISEMKIVGLQAPTNLAYTKNNDGSVSFIFTTTNDIGVEYKIAKTEDGVTTYLDAPGGECTDTNVDPRKTNTYKSSCI